MRQLARSAALTPAVISTAHAIARGAPDRSPSTLARALRAELAARIDYLADPAVSDTETIRTPAAMLAELHATGRAQGDCDDVATLAAALCAALGMPAQLVALAWGGFYGHVYAEALDPDTGHALGVDFDVTARGGETAREAASHALTLAV